MPIEDIIPHPATSYINDWRDWRNPVIESNIEQDAHHEARMMGINPDRRYHSEFDNSSTSYMYWAIRKIMLIEERVKITDECMRTLNGKLNRMIEIMELKDENPFKESV